MPDKKPLDLKNLKNKKPTGSIIRRKVVSGKFSKKRRLKKHASMLAGRIRQNVKPLSVVIAMIFILAIAGIMINKSSHGNNNPVASNAPSAPVRVMEKKAESFSRITFFFTEPLKGSLAMPGHWEGRYRMRGDDNVATFNYIDILGNTSPLFSISEYPQADWDKMQNKDGLEILSKDKFSFVYRKFANNPYQGEEAQKFQKMLLEADQIIKSFNPFKL